MAISSSSSSSILTIPTSSFPCSSVISICASSSSFWGGAGATYGFTLCTCLKIVGGNWQLALNASFCSISLTIPFKPLRLSHSLQWSKDCMTTPINPMPHSAQWPVNDWLGMVHHARNVSCDRHNLANSLSGDQIDQSDCAIKTESIQWYT